MITLFTEDEFRHVETFLQILSQVYMTLKILIGSRIYPFKGLKSGGIKNLSI